MTPAVSLKAKFESKIGIKGKLGSQGLMNVQFMYPSYNNAWNHVKKFSFGLMKAKMALHGISDINNLLHK